MWPRLPQNVCQGRMTDLQPAAAAAGLLFEGQTWGMREHAAAEAWSPCQPHVAVMVCRKYDMHPASEKHECTGQDAASNL